MIVILHACTIQKDYERKVMKRKIKDYGLLSRNVNMGYCSGFCMNAS